MDIDKVVIELNESTVNYINAIVGVLMFGVALSIRFSDFKYVLKHPKMVLVGFLSQYLLLPILTVLLILLLDVHPSLALGMILVAACPGGTVSNFMCLLLDGNLALSVSLTAISTIISGVMIPTAFFAWASLVPEARSLLTSIDVDYWGILKLSLLMLVLPLTLGMLFNHFSPSLSKKMSKFFKWFGVIVFLGIVLGAFLKNIDVFLAHFNSFFWLVLLHNGLALIGGYLLAKLTRLEAKEQRTIAIETGIQNSSIGLAIIFSFFADLGGMLIITAWWGIWHLVSGLSFSFIYKKMIKK